MPKFEKGNAGKAKGTRDNRWASVSFWFGELKKDWVKLTPNQRANLSVELIRMLTAKMKAMPVSPEDSAMNVDEMMKELTQIEARIQPVSPKPDEGARPG